MSSKQPPAVQVSGSLYQRPGSVNWWYSLTVPPELSRLPQYLGKDGKPIKWAHRRSLGTSDKAEAERLAVGVLQRFQDQWAIERRQANPVRVSALSAEVVAQLADYIRFCVFNADDLLRESPQVARRVAALRGLAVGTMTKEHALEAIHAPAGDYLDDFSADGLEGLNLDRDTKAGKAVARRNHEAILNDARAASQWLGVSYDWTKPEARPHLLRLMEAKRTALEEPSITSTPLRSGRHTSLNSNWCRCIMISNSGPTKSGMSKSSS
jgi:hypothetical protein